MSSNADSEIDIVIGKCVEEIWYKYDDDHSGYLDKQETKLFVQDTLADMSNDKGFNDDEFER